MTGSPDHQADALTGVATASLRPATWTAYRGPPTPRPSPAPITSPDLQANILARLATMVAEAVT